MELATFAAGCFWGIEVAFRLLPGVSNVTVGYEGGIAENPSYREVCSGTTGHAEVVQVEFDPTKIGYDRLLQEFWKIHNPTTLNRQGPDIGTQYRSAIFYHSEAQRLAAEASLKEEQKRFAQPIVTEIVPAAKFWPAEEYHQRYLEKAGRTFCPSSLK